MILLLGVQQDSIAVCRWRPRLCIQNCRVLCYCCYICCRRMWHECWFAHKCRIILNWTKKKRFNQKFPAVGTVYYQCVPNRMNLCGPLQAYKEPEKNINFSFWHLSGSIHILVSESKLIFIHEHTYFLMMQQWWWYHRFLLHRFAMHAHLITGRQCTTWNHVGCICAICDASTGGAVYHAWLG